MREVILPIKHNMLSETVIRERLDGYVLTLPDYEKPFPYRVVDVLPRIVNIAVTLPDSQVAAEEEFNNLRAIRKRMLERCQGLGRVDREDNSYVDRT